MLPPVRVRSFGDSSQRCDESDHRCCPVHKNRDAAQAGWTNICWTDKILLVSNKPRLMKRMNPSRWGWGGSGMLHPKKGLLNMVLLQRYIANRSVGPELQQNPACERVE